MTAIARTAQSLTPGDRVNLFILDLTPIGVGQIFYLTNSVNKKEDGTYEPLRFGGVDYTPVDIKTSGWELTGQGPFPRPKVTVSNALDFLAGLLYEFDDLVGAKFTRVRTYRQFLDGEAEADPTAYYPPDIYRIEQKTKQGATEIEFVLAAAVDQQGLTVPRRKMLRDTCTHTYRIPKPGGGFDYSKATCPFAEARYYDASGNPTTADKDQCGLLLSDCRLRFRPAGGVKQPLPTRAFPGLIRTTVQ
ncbi:phage minor tail protein L [Brucella intermedia]|uniref:phage minor tail protein L n=1 Tax=Brucella TaxID=234 RepID=UPI00094641C6|nr:phage minor tail protein L [Brucella intermedia]